jgi:hypothetical protein
MSATAARNGWPLALAIPGIAYTLLSLQAGFDLQRAGVAVNGVRLALLLGKGALLGTAGIALLALFAYAVLRASGTRVTAGAAIRAFAMAHVIPLLYAVCGMGLNLVLGWNTALACGVTGLLWALGPLTGSLQELSGGKSWLAATLSTLTGGLLLFAWLTLGVGS